MTTELEERVASLESKLDQALNVGMAHGDQHWAEGSDPAPGFFIEVPAESDLPTTRAAPTLYKVTGPPVLLYMVGPDGKSQLGWSALAEAASALTLTTSNQDVEGCSVTLPAPGAYIVRAVLDFQLQAASVLATGTLSAIGVLTDSSDVEVDTPRAALAEWEDPFGVMSNDGMVRATVTQMWRVATTTSDEVFKLRARRSNPGASVTLKALSPHTTIMASGFLGGDETATTHAHPHSATTGRGEDDHHPADELSDDDGNTKVEVEQSANENIVRITAGGVEVVRVDSAEMEIARFLSVGSLEAVTISSGFLTISRSQVAISPEGGVADSIDNIVGGLPGRQVFLFNAHTVVDITLNHLTGAAGRLIFFPDGKSVVLTPLTGIWMVAETFGWTPAAPVYHSAYTDADAQAAVPLEIWMDLGHDRGGHPAIG